jgi:hypothetical protein
MKIIPSQQKMTTQNNTTPMWERLNNRILYSESFIIWAVVFHNVNGLRVVSYRVHRAAAHQLRQDKHQDIRQKRKSWRQHHDSDRCAAVFIISFVSTVFLSSRHVADIVPWLLHVLTHAGVRPTIEVACWYCMNKVTLRLVSSLRSVNNFTFARTSQQHAA